MKIKEIINNLIPDFSAVPGLLKFLSGGFTAIPKIFSKNFFKERYYLHIFVTLPIVLAVIRLGFLYFHFADFNICILILVGWIIGYTINLIREGLLEYLGKAKFDWCDVHAGGYSGIIGTIIYILL
jgi:hypothetical protein